MSTDNKINTSWPAFPAEMPIEGGRQQFPGMTLRDYFAAKAMAAVINKYPEDTAVALLVGWAYEIADAMLAQREKPLP